MGRITSAILGGFGKVRRPFAWVCLVLGVVLLVGIFTDVIQTGSAKIATVLGALLVFLDGYDKVAEVEQDLDSEASADE